MHGAHEKHSRAEAFETEARRLSRLAADAASAAAALARGAAADAAAARQETQRAAGLPLVRFSLQPIAVFVVEFIKPSILPRNMLNVSRTCGRV